MHADYNGAAIIDAEGYFWTCLKGHTANIQTTTRNRGMTIVHCACAWYRLPRFHLA